MHHILLFTVMTVNPACEGGAMHVSCGPVNFYPSPKDIEVVAVHLANRSNYELMYFHQQQGYYCLTTTDI